MNITSVQNTEAVESSSRVTSSQPKVRVLGPFEALSKGQGEAEGQGNDLDAQAVEEMTEVLNEYMDDLQTNLGFSIREDLENQVVVEIKNRETDELIRQIPSEELLTIMENMRELNGIIFDQSV
jgi:flagellar protein FlaG